MRVDAFLDAFDAHCSCLLEKIGALFMKAGEITKGCLYLFEENLSCNRKKNAKEGILQHQ